MWEEGLASGTHGDETQKHTLKGPVRRKGMGPVIRKLLERKPRTKHLDKNYRPASSFSKNREGGSMSPTICEASITQTPKPDKDPQENNWPTSPMTVDAEILSKMLVNRLSNM